MRLKLTSGGGIAGLALLALIAVIGPTYAAAGSGGVSHSAKGTKTLRFDEKGTYVKLVDNPPANTTQNPEAGDTILFRSDLISGERQIGTSHGFCTFIDPPLAQCVSTMNLRSGKLAFMDGLTFGTGKPYDFTMVGGTGVYRSTHGQAQITQLAPTHFRWIVKIKR